MLGMNESEKQRHTILYIYTVKLAVRGHIWNKEIVAL